MSADLNKFGQYSEPKIALLDITISDTNTGNQIIMQAIRKHLREIFPMAFHISIPSFERIGRVSREILYQSDIIFLCGGNTLTAHNWLFQPWKIGLRDVGYLKGKVVAVGVGWLRYEGNPDFLTRWLYRTVMSREWVHSVRDSYTEAKLRALGFQVLNTGCPSLWDINPKHLEDVPSEKGESVLMTLTKYRQDVDRDRRLFEVLRQNYCDIYFWPQQPGDLEYARSVMGSDISSVHVVPPQLEDLDVVLGSNLSLDYVGTRLHAFIRSLQHKRRSILVAVDSRGIEMGKDFNFPMVSRRTLVELHKLIAKKWRPSIKLPTENIELWKRQFRIILHGR